jgi:NAD(P)-dependent dehydrogenase (short-subunit alcohol dehydrogenase family)
MLLKDKIALVTGSTHNIGLAIARAFADEGAKVIVHSRHEEDAKKVAQEICADYFIADLAKPEQIAALFDHIREKYGRLDILVNSVAQSSSAGVLETSLDEWNRIMTINLTGYFLCIQHAGKMMKEQGGGAIAAAAVFLVSDKAAYITNTILPVDGGRLNSMSSGSSR